jgi:hypothetical protein
MTVSNLFPPIAWIPIATNEADANGAFAFTQLEATNR